MGSHAQGPNAPLQVQQTAYLKASNPDAADHFGCGGENQGHNGQGVSLSADGRTLAVGAPHESSAARGVNGNQADNSVFDAGAVYVFTRTGVGDSWAQQAYVKPSNPQAGAEFGHYVALSADGNTLAVSAYWEASAATGVNGNQRDESIPQAGAVYLFTRSGGTWTQQAYVKASNTGEAGTADTFGEGDQFGWSLALSGDGNTIAVGAITEDGASAGVNGDQRNNSAQGAGAVYVFTRTGSTWMQHAYVKPSNVDAGDMFGYSVALSRDGYTLAASSFDEDGSGRGVEPLSDNRNAGSGAVYVFARVASNWSQQAYIKPSNSEPQDSFGVHVALSDDGGTLLAGSLDEDCRATGVNPQGCDSDWDSDLSMGAAYVFVRTASSSWSQQAFLKASNTGPNDWFGARVALSGDGNTAAIGAPFEDSGAKGVNGRQDDDSAGQAGAVYLFTRTGTAWRQRAYVKGSNTEAFDEFGSSVALDRTGTTLAASARGEDSLARGINGNQGNNAAAEAGAAYVFRIGAPATPAAQQRPPDMILVNGKIVTVDERFSMAQAVAIGDWVPGTPMLDGHERGRIIAVGTNKAIEALADRTTRRIDLQGRTVIPGLIDNHMHLLRAGTTWQREVRLDGAGYRRQALDLLRERAMASPPGEWIYTLGGWTLDQFADDPRPFTPAELDRVAPVNPVFLQASYYRGYANTLAMTALGLDSGVVEESRLRGVAARLPVATGAALESSTRQMIRDLNRAGLTSFGSAGCEPDVLPLYVRWSQKDALNVRVFCIIGLAPGTPEQVTAALPRIRNYRVRHTENLFVDDVAYGETVYGPLHDPMFVRASDPQPQQLEQWRRVATEVAKAGLPLHVHANLTNTITAFLDQIELIDREHPIRNLRWTLAHVNQINASHLERMRTLGMSAAVHPWAVINGGINPTVFGQAALDMAPLRTLQASGVVWGLGSDGSRANQILPFQTLSWAVTGRMVGGNVVLRESQRLSREAALAAHTRQNAYLMFQEKNLGSIEAGKLADLVVLDRDYLTVPADQIKDIAATMTIVNGRIAYQR
jgi:predicted amidohydrolase YtcJ